MSWTCSGDIRTHHRSIQKVLNHEWNRSMMCPGRINSAEIRSNGAVQEALEHIIEAFISMFMKVIKCS